MKDLNIKYFLVLVILSIIFINVLNNISSTYKVNISYDSILGGSRIIETKTEEPVKTVPRFHPNIEYQKWAVNLNILQHSSFFLLTNTGTVRTETIFAFGFVENEALLNDTFTFTKIHCFLRNRETNQVEVYNSKRVFRLFERPMTNLTYRIPWKAVCELQNLTDIDKWDIAIIDSEDQYEKRLTFDITKERINQYINYQKPKIIDTTKPKIKGIGHCLHAIRYLDDSKVERLLKWLSFQHLLGYNEIKIYFFENATNVTETIYSKYDRNFIKIVEAQMNYEDVCEWYIKYFNENPEDFIANYLNSYCKAIWTRTFIFTPDLSDETNYIHGRSETNDCFLQYKYKFEFTTNYDFDEYLLPRKYAPFGLTNDAEFLKCDAKPFAPFQYNIYNYTIDLFHKHGRDNLASIELDCLPYLNDDINMTSFFQRLHQAYDNRANVKPGETTEIWLEKIIFPKRYMAYIAYLVNHTDYDYINNLFKLYDLYKCLRNSTAIVSDFNNGIISGYNLWYYPMKSIFNTDLTEYTTLHYAHPMPNARIHKLPIEEGFVSHLRDKTDRYYHREKVSIRHFGFDIEYYKFFLNHY